MKAIKFKESNLVLKAGDNPDTVDMPAAKAIDPSGTKFIIGKFQLTPEERKLFLQKGEIWLGVMGGQWPPMMMTTYNPFSDFDFKLIKPTRGLPDMKYRDEVDAMLKTIFKNQQTEEQWNGLIEMIGETFKFELIAEDIDRVINENPDAVKEDCIATVLEEYRKQILVEIQKDFNGAP